jgi:dTDP-4-dehydrorhamnose 3,5-epimerase
MIEGVILTPLNQIFDERGKVMHMLSTRSNVFTKFGEIYFSCTYPSVVKAWHLHTEMTLNYAVVAGEIKFVLYDDRENSSTRGEIQELFISPENYMLVTVPPMVWNGFKSVGPNTAIVANCSDIPHDDREIQRRSPDDPAIPYSWALEHR